MAITKSKKLDIVESLTNSLSNAVSVVFVHFKGLTVADTSAMRKSLKSEGIGYYVAKKTLIKRVLAAKGITGILPETLGRDRARMEQ